MSFRVVVDTDNGYRAFFAGLRDIKHKRAKVGIQGDEAEQINNGIAMFDLATIHEFGSKSVDKRSFLRSTADQNMLKYGKAFARSIRRLLRNPNAFSPEGELIKVGNRLRTDIVRRMSRGDITPDIKESTKRSRGEEGPPLVDSGTLKNSITVVIT